MRVSKAFAKPPEAEAVLSECAARGALGPYLTHVNYRIRQGARANPQSGKASFDGIPYFR